LEVAGRTLLQKESAGWLIDDNPLLNANIGVDYFPSSRGVIFVVSLLSLSTTSQSSSFVVSLFVLIDLPSSSARRDT